MKYTNPLYQPRPDSSPMAREMVRQVERLTELAYETVTPPIDYVTYTDFKNTMLPVLAAVAHGREIDQERWASLVSHNNVEVVVVDDATHKELYRISSIYQNTEIAADIVEGPCISAAAVEASKQRFVSLPMAQQHLIDAMYEFTVPVTREEMLESGIEAIERLNKIFKDHDLPLLPDPRDFLKMEKKVEDKGDKTTPAVETTDEFDLL